MSLAPGRIAILVCALFFASLALFQIQTGKLDEIALALIVLSLATMLLPVIRTHVRSIELPSGVKVELLEFKVRRQEAQLDHQREIINQLVVFSMAFYLYRMLDDFYNCETGLLQEYVFRKGAHFENHIRYLRDHGYIEMTFQVASLQDGQDIAELVKLTPVGKFYVELRRSYEAAGLRLTQDAPEPSVGV